MSRPQLILADLHPRGQETPRGLLASCLSCFFKRTQSKTVDLLNAAEVEDVEVTGHFFVFWEVFLFGRFLALCRAVWCKSVIILSAKKKTLLDDRRPAGKQLPAPSFYWLTSDTILTITPKPCSTSCLKVATSLSRRAGKSWRLLPRPKLTTLQRNNPKRRSTPTTADAG